MRLSILAVSVLLAGCATPQGATRDGPTDPAAPTRDAGETSGFFDARSDPITQVDIIPGLHRSHGTLTWEPVTVLEPDLLHLVGLKATAWTNYTLDMHQELWFSTPAEGRILSDSACALELASYPLSAEWGEFYLNRSLGRDQAPPQGAPNFSGGTGAVGGGALVSSPAGRPGLGGGLRSRNGTLEPGGWLLLGAGLSGVGPDALEGDSSWWFAVEADRHLEAYDLRVAPLHCGFGYGQLQDSTMHAQFMHVGGHLQVPSPYGATFEHKSNCYPVMTLPGPFNQGSLDFAGVVVPLSEAERSLYLWNLTAGPSTMQIDQWYGWPFWVLVGFALPGMPLRPADFVPLCG